MKKIIFGSLLTLTGLVFAAVFVFNALQHSWNYNGIDGLLGSLLGTETLPFCILSLVILIAGLVICGYEAYRKK